MDQDDAVVEDQSEVVDFLSHARAFGAADNVAVERIDTHGAIVFLVGDRVWKLKRAVRYPFMDFSTPARRRAMCCAEVAINRRTAPQIYLGVAAIERHDDGLRLSAAVEPDAAPPSAVDWLVVMRRFDGRQLLEEVVARDELTSAIVDRLAEAVARFHRDAERFADRGGATALAEAVALDVQQMQARGELLDAAATAQLASAMPAAAARAAALAERRREVGAVRRCHGDLHLGNVFLDGDVPVPFDAIEFNDRISCIDTLYDLAFLLMDLDLVGLRPAANRLLNRYLWLCDGADSDNLSALGLLPIYLARRGAIRAHVGAAGLAHLAAAERQRERNKAHAYQAYALKALRPVAPRLIGVGGLSGTGKTTLALAVAPQIGAAPGAVVLRSDVVRKRMAGVALQERMPPGWYTAENSAAIYRELNALARIGLEAGHSIVVDAVFAQPNERRALQAVAEQLSVPFAGLWLEAPGDMLKQRVGARQGDASDATPEVVERQLAYDLRDISWHRVAAGQAPPVVQRAAQAFLGMP